MYPAERAVFLELLTKILREQEDVFGESDLYVANTLDRLAYVRLEKEAPDEQDHLIAERYLRRSLEIRKRHEDRLGQCRTTFLLIQCLWRRQIAETKRLAAEVRELLAREDIAANDPYGQVEHLRDYAEELRALPP